MTQKTLKERIEELEAEYGVIAVKFGFEKALESLFTQLVKECVGEELKKFWKDSFAIFPCSGGKKCENCRALTKLNQKIAKALEKGIEV